MFPLVFSAYGPVLAEVSPIAETVDIKESGSVSQEVVVQPALSVVEPQKPAVAFSSQVTLSNLSSSEYDSSDGTTDEFITDQSVDFSEFSDHNLQWADSDEARWPAQELEQPDDVNPEPIEESPVLEAFSQEKVEQIDLPLVEPAVQGVVFSHQRLSSPPEENPDSFYETSKDTTDVVDIQTGAQPIAQEPEPSELDEAQLFEQVFGQPEYQAPTQVELPFILNGRTSGNILVYPHSDIAHVTVAGNTFLSLTQQSLSETIRNNLQSAITSDDRLSLVALQDEGVEVFFDRRHLELHVDVPPDLRVMAVNSISDTSQQPNESELALPGQLSGYLNLRGSQTINWTNPQQKLEPLGLQFDGAVNWRGWVLETYGQATLGQSWQLDRFSVVRDAPDQALRYTLGDLSVPTAGYQTSPSLFGISVARDFSLQPFKVARPTSNYSFFLERVSIVEVFVNDELTTTLRLDAGPQDIRDLPLKVGINDIRLEITNDLGQTETLNFSTGIAGELLAEGVHQFAYSAGFPTIEQQPLKSYDLSQPTLSMFHRVGLTPNMTLGGYLQGDMAQQMVGLNGTWATTVGNFGWDMAASNHADYGVDVAGKFFYEWLDASQVSSHNRRLRLALEYRGEDFSTLGQETPRNSTAVNISVAYQQALFENIQARVNGEYQIKREGSDTYNIGVNLSRPLGQGLNLNLGYAYRQDASRQTNHRFSIGFNGALPFSGQRFNTRTEFNNTLEPQNTFNWSYSPNHALGTIAPNLTLTQSPQSYGVNGRLQYQGYRSTLGLNHQLTLPRDHQDSIESSSTVTWGTAIAFVDGVWGWSRPIDNSFALITRQGSAVGETVRVNPTLSGDLAQANGSGPAVLSIAPYHLTQMSLDAPELSLGEDLGQTSHQLLPTYRSGTLITTGTEATVFLRGILVDENQEPITLQQGWVESLSAPDWPTVDFFTNRTGRFVAVGLKPGLYQLHLSVNGGKTLKFEIPEQQQGNFNIGVLQLPGILPSAQSDI